MHTCSHMHIYIYIHTYMLIFPVTQSAVGLLPKSLSEDAGRLSPPEMSGLLSWSARLLPRAQREEKGQGASDTKTIQTT